MIKFSKSFRNNLILVLCLLVALSSINILKVDSGLTGNDTDIVINAGDLSLNWDFLVDEAVQKTPTTAESGFSLLLIMSFLLLVSCFPAIIIRRRN